MAAPLFKVTEPDKSSNRLAELRFENCWMTAFRTFESRHRDMTPTRWVVYFFLRLKCIRLLVKSPKYLVTYTLNAFDSYINRVWIYGIFLLSCDSLIVCWKEISLSVKLITVQYTSMYSKRRAQFFVCNTNVTLFQMNVTFAFTN